MHYNYNILARKTGNERPLIFEQGKGSEMRYRREINQKKKNIY